MRLVKSPLFRTCCTDDDTLVELCCTRSNIEIKRMKDAYARLFGRPLIQVVRSETSGAYRKLLVRVLLGLRDESPKTSRKSAEVQAAALNKAMSKWKVDRDAIIDLLTKCSAAQLAVVSDVYAETYGIDLEAAIDGSLSSLVSGGFKRVCKTLVKDPITVFCELLNKAFEGWGEETRPVAPFFSDGYFSPYQYLCYCLRLDAEKRVAEADPCVRPRY